MFKIFFKDLKGDKDFLTYNIIENEFNKKWFKKLKSIHKLSPDLHDSRLSMKINERSLIKDTYKKFCLLTGETYKKLDFSKQTTLNFLHELYEKNNNKITNDIIYEFHGSIHYAENKINNTLPQGVIYIGWGIKEGPLMNRYNSQIHYTREDINSGDIYLAWSELAKIPTVYFRDNEPNDQKRFNSLVKPNITHRPKFKIYKKSFSYLPFELKFTEWFKTYKQSWLNLYELEDWQPYDEQGGVHLAQVQEKNIEEFFNRYPFFDSIQISH